MTRINCVPVEELADQHLIAEYRELPRVFALARPDPKAPAEYTLGTGHVRFFYSRTGYLSRRQGEIIAECLRRGFDIAHRTPPAPIPGLDADWEPDDRALAINRERIAERIREKAKTDPTFYRFTVPSAEAIASGLHPRRPDAEEPVALADG